MTCALTVYKYLQDTFGSVSDKADHHTTQASKQGQSYLDSAKDQANQMFGQGKVAPSLPPLLSESVHGEARSLCADASCQDLLGPRRASPAPCG